MKPMTVNGVTLYVDTYGDPGDPAILLIGGAGGPMDWWEPGFCQQLADGGRYVIRYDMRDTGQSVNCPPGRPGYTGEDLADDAVGLLDALGVQTAHLVGISMGGALAQRVAAEHPDRVESLVLLSTTVALPGDGPHRTHLPGMSDDLRAYFADPPTEPDWTDPAAVTAYLVDFDRRLSGPEYFDEAHTRAIVEQIVRRSTDIRAGTTNHWQAEDGAPPRHGMAAIDAPTLVVHGTADPMFPYPQHPEALLRQIRNASLLPLPGVGHQVPPPKVWPIVVPAILEHTDRCWRTRCSARVLSGCNSSPTSPIRSLIAASAASVCPKLEQCTTASSAYRSNTTAGNFRSIQASNA